MKANEKASFINIFLPLLVTLTLVGLIGIIIILRHTLPTLGPRWLLFFFIVIALTGPGIPITYYLNQRFPSTPPAEGLVIIRQALWFGIFGCILTWLQLGRVLTPVLAGIMAGVLILIEFLLRLFERSRWKPNNNE